MNTNIVCCLSPQPQLSRVAEYMWITQSSKCCLSPHVDEWNLLKDCIDLKGKE